MISEISMPGRCFQARNRLLFAALASLIPGLVCGQTPICPSGTCYLAPSGVNVGIGTASPGASLQIGNTTLYQQDARLTMATSSGQGQFRAWSVGTKYGGSVGTSPNYGFAIRDESIGVERFVVDWATGNVGIGTTNPLYKLAVNGNIGAQDIVVTNTGWSDYVFRPGYRLRPLSEVHKFIQANHHLPDVPSEAEVKEKGVSVGEMQARLLAKIEELTLHMIQRERENQELREHMIQQNQELRDRIARLEEAARGRTE